MKILRKLLKALLFGVACLVTVILLAWAFENVRGRVAWGKYSKEVVQRGETLDPKGIIPPPVPDASNFAAFPIFAPLFDFKPGTQLPRDSNVLAQAKAAFELKGEIKEICSNNWNTWVQGPVDLKRFIASAEPKIETNAQPGTPMDQSHMTREQKTFLRRYGYAMPAEPQIDEKMTDEQAARETLLFLRGYDKLLAQVEEAAKRPLSRWPVNYQHAPMFDISLPHLQALREVARLLQVRAAAEIQLGQAQDAAHDIYLILRLADSIQNEPFLISFLVRNSIMHLSLQPLADGLSTRLWTDAQLQQFQKEYRDRYLLKDMPAILRGETLLFGLTGMDQIRRGAVKGETYPGFKGFQLMPDGWFYLEMISFHKVMQSFTKQYAFEAGKIDPEEVNRFMEEATDMLSEKPLQRFWHHNVFSSILLPALGRVAERGAKGQSGVNFAVIACALERYHMKHGSYPESLDALGPLLEEPLPCDIIRGEPLHYKAGPGDTYTLYSIGWNGKDDNATVRIKADSDSDREPDWVWRPLRSR